MIESLKRMDRKFLIFISCLILIPLLLIVFLVLAQGCSNRKTSYSKYEFKMKSAAKKYLTEIDNLPQEVGDYVMVDLNTLVENSYIESPKKSIGKSCTGYIGVRKTSTINYVSVLNCGDYKTSTLKETILNDLTESGDGLYKTADGYVFKGLNVNNYVNLYGTIYRIISIDDKNAVKLYKTESESIQMYWDSKYNVDTKAPTGLNIYKDSYVLELLNKAYDTSTKLKKIKPHMISSDVCVYSKAKSDRFLDKSKCKEVLPNQYITLLSIDDFMNASLDPNCVDMYSKSCKNYNYLGRNGSVFTWTKDIVSDNSYQVYYLSNGIPTAFDANYYNSYNFVIFIDGDEFAASGNGSKKTPYVIK